MRGRVDLTGTCQTLTCPNWWPDRPAERAAMATGSAVVAASADHRSLGEAVALPRREVVGAGGDDGAHGLVVGHPPAGVEVVELALAAVGHEVAEAQLLVVDHVGELGLDGLGRRLEPVERQAHVD